MFFLCYYPQKLKDGFFQYTLFSNMESLTLYVSGGKNRKLTIDDDDWDF